MRKLTATGTSAAPAQKTTRNIPREEWVEFFDGFSRRHQEWLVSLVVRDPDLAGGTPMELVHEQPLQGIAAEPGKDDQRRIVIITGSAPFQHMDHIVSDCRTVRLEQDESGADVSVEICSLCQLHRLTFRAPALPEEVDGI